MDGANSLRRFFLCLAEHSDVPLHGWYAKHGHAWPAVWGAGSCIYHHVLVLPYVGAFDRRTAYRRAIPRIHLNDHDPRWHAPATRLERQARAEFPGTAVTLYGARLELTATIEELPLLAAWVVSWTKAKVANNPIELGPPPVPMEHAWSPTELLECDYAWTKAASDEYEAAPATIAARRSNAAGLRQHVA